MGLFTGIFLFDTCLFVAAYYTSTISTPWWLEKMCNFSLIVKIVDIFINSLIYIYIYTWGLIYLCFFLSHRFLFFFFAKKKHLWRLSQQGTRINKNRTPQSCASRDVSRPLPQGVLQWQGHCLANRVAPWPSELPIVVCALQIPSHFPLVPMDYTPEKFNIAPKNRQSQKETHLPTIIFQGLC